MNSVGAHSSSKVQVLQPDHHDGDSPHRQQDVADLERMQKKDSLRRPNDGQGNQSTTWYFFGILAK